MHIRLGFFSLLLLVLALFACQNNDSSTSATAPKTAMPPIDSLFSRYQEERLPLYPIEATIAGDPRYNDLLPSLSQAYRTALNDFYLKYHNLTQQYDRDKLSDNDRIGYDILIWECDINLEDLQYPKHLLPINQFDCLPLLIAQYAGGTGAQPFKTPADYDNWLRRLDAFAVWCDTAIVNMRQGMATGYVLPKVLAEKVVPQMAEFDHGPVDKHLFYSPVHQFPKDFSNEDRSRLTRAYAHAVRDQIIPLYKRLHDFFKNEYVPACRASAGISAVPNGNAFYAHQIKTYEGIHFGCIDPKQVRHCQVFDAGRSCITRALDLPASKTCQSQMGTEISIVCAYIYLVDKGLLVLTRRTGRPALIVQQMAKQPHRR